MLKHFPRCGMDFLLHIFNLSWSLYFFPSIWKTSFIVPIHKIEKPLNSPAAFGLSFTPPTSVSFLNASFYYFLESNYLFFIESNSTFSSRQADFRPGRSTLDQILFLFQYISGGLNKSRPGSQSILATIGFSKAFDSVWHPALFHEFISAGLPPCFARWTQSFLSDRSAYLIFQSHESCSFRVCRGVSKSCSWPCTFIFCHQ